KKEYPRRAGISSFGAGGANAHLLIEEYKPHNDSNKGFPVPPKQPVIIVLSAKVKDQLKKSASLLLEAIEQQELTNNHLDNISFTLQTGREALEERLAFIVNSIEDLRNKLNSYIQQGKGNELVTGRSSSRKDLSIISDESIVNWIEAADYHALMEAWVKGNVINWNILYGKKKPARISLPVSPFVKESYWIKEVKIDNQQNNDIDSLVYQNISDI